MRALVWLLAAAALVAATGCETGACRGVDGACVALTVTGYGSVDGVEITLSGAATGTKVAPQTATIQALPVEIGLQLPSAANGPLHLDLVGVLGGAIVGNGSGDVTVSSGAHASVTIALSSDVVAGGDGGMPNLPFNVTGTRVRHYQLADGGVVDVPGDETGASIAVETIDADGGVTTIAGSGDANGNLTVQRVRSAPYYLRFDTTYLFGSAKTFDLGYFIEGRPDQTPATKQTMLGFNVTNLDPWASTDALEFFSMNAGTAIFGVETLFNPGNGATTLNNSLDLSKMAFGNLIDSAKGDDAFLVQLVGDTNNGVPYERLAKIANFPPFAIADGGNSAISAAMTDVAQSGSLAVAWTRSQFAQYRTAVNPQATADLDSFSLFAMPGGTAHGWFTSTPDLVIVKPAAGASDVSLTATYGNPFPASWPLVGAAGTQFAVTYAAAGASSATFDGAVFTFAPLASLASPIVPVISPVQSATIDGHDALAGVPSASAMPLLAWSAPAVGTASSYGVSIYAIDNVGGKTSFDPVATLYTKETSLTVPPGLLAGGQLYLFVITAYADAIDRTASPFLDALPTAYADALSGAVNIRPTALATNCKELHTAQPGLPDGIYTIDPDGSGAAPPVAVYCDMTSDGGGWTLCSWSMSPTPEAIGWVVPSAMQSANWYACQKYSAMPVEARVRVANASKTYTNRYANVDFRPSAGTTTYTPAVGQAPNFSFQILPNSSGCNNASNNNFQWVVFTTESIYGQTAKNNCSTGMAEEFIASSGANTNGCWGNNQVSPQIGFPCGGYGDFGLHMEIWAR